MRILLALLTAVSVSQAVIAQSASDKPVRAPHAQLTQQAPLLPINEPQDEQAAQKANCQEEVSLYQALGKHYTRVKQLIKYCEPFALAGDVGLMRLMFTVYAGLDTGKLLDLSKAISWAEACANHSSAAEEQKKECRVAADQLRQAQSDPVASASLRVCGLFTPGERAAIERYFAVRAANPAKYSRIYSNFFGADGKVSDNSDWRDILFYSIKSDHGQMIARWEELFDQLSGAVGVYQAMADCSPSAREIASIVGEQGRKEQEARSRAAQENATPQGHLRDVYVSYIGMQECYKSRKQYAIQYVNRVDLDRARSITRRDEGRLLRVHPELAKHKDKIWDDAKRDFTDSQLGTWTRAGAFIEDAATLCGLIKLRYTSDSTEQRNRIKKDF